MKIAKKLDRSEKVVSRWVLGYYKNRIEALMGNKFRGNHRNMSFEAEKQFMVEFETLANNGRLIEIREIEQAYKKLVGHSICSGQIYRVLP